MNSYNTSVSSALSNSRNPHSNRLVNRPSLTQTPSSGVRLQVDVTNQPLGGRFSTESLPTVTDEFVQYQRFKRFVEFEKSTDAVRHNPQINGVSGVNSQIDPQSLERDQFQLTSRSSGNGYDESLANRSDGHDMSTSQVDNQSNSSVEEDDDVFLDEISEVDEGEPSEEGVQGGLPGNLLINQHTKLDTRSTSENSSFEFGWEETVASIREFSQAVDWNR